MPDLNSIIPSLKIRPYCKRVATLPREIFGTFLTLMTPRIFEPTCIIIPPRRQAAVWRSAEMELNKRARLLRFVHVMSNSVYRSSVGVHVGRLMDVIALAQSPPDCLHGLGLCRIIDYRL